MVSPVYFIYYHCVLQTYWNAGQVHGACMSFTPPPKESLVDIKLYPVTNLRHRFLQGGPQQGRPQHVCPQHVCPQKGCPQRGCLSKVVIIEVALSKVALSKVALSEIVLSEVTLSEVT